MNHDDLIHLKVRMWELLANQSTFPPHDAPALRYTPEQAAEQVKTAFSKLIEG